MVHRLEPMAPLWVNNKTEKVYAFDKFVTDCTNATEGRTMVEYHEINKPHTVFVREYAEFLVKFSQADV